MIDNLQRSYDDVAEDMRTISAPSWIRKPFDRLEQ